MKLSQNISETPQPQSLSKVNTNGITKIAFKLLNSDSLQAGAKLKRLTDF